jgi:hypothetical protein
VKYTWPIAEQLARFEAWCEVVKDVQTDNGPLVKNGGSKADSEKHPWAIMVRGITKHIKQGCFVDSDDANHYKVIEDTSTGKQLLAVSRGSTGNESFHKVLAGVIGVNSDHVTAATNASTASLRITVQALRKRDLCSAGSHWFVWKTKTRSDLESKLYKLDRPRFKLPPIGGLQLPVSWDEACPLRESGGLTSGTVSLSGFTCMLTLL